MATQTANQLIASAVALGYDALSFRDLLECLLYAAQTGGGGGGGGGEVQVYQGNYGGASPAGFVTLPAGVTAAVAVDNSNGRLWLFYSNGWN